MILKAKFPEIPAGNDMICTTRYKDQFQAVYKAFKDGKISKAQINESVKRILIMKLNLLPANAAAPVIESSSVMITPLKFI